MTTAGSGLGEIVLENYGPIGLLIVYLWRRLNKLEISLKEKQGEQDEKIQKNSRKIQENRWQIKAIGGQGTTDNAAKQRQ